MLVEGFRDRTWEALGAQVRYRMKLTEIGKRMAGRYECRWQMLGSLEQSILSYYMQDHRVGECRLRTQTRGFMNIAEDLVMLIFSQAIGETSSWVRIIFPWNATNVSPFKLARLIMFP